MIETVEGVEENDWELGKEDWVHEGDIQTVCRFDVPLTAEQLAELDVSEEDDDGVYYSYREIIETFQYLVSIPDKEPAPAAKYVRETWGPKQFSAWCEDEDCRYSGDKDHPMWRMSGSTSPAAAAKAHTRGSMHRTFVVIVGGYVNVGQNERDAS